MSTTQSTEPIAAGEDEHLALDRIAQLLDENQPQPPLQFLDADGQVITLPGSLAHVLREAAHFLAKNDTIALVPVERDLTTQQAADLLNVSCLYLIKLLESGALPFHKTGAYRRVPLAALLAYKRRRDEKRERALDELTQLHQDMGLYDIS